MARDGRKVLLFRSTSHVMRAEKLLRGADIRCRVIPVPRHISSQCGVCLRLESADTDRACASLAAAGMQVEGIFDASQE